ncbi:hypothetical protein G6F22_021812 [Rhizopus arrhizus]|nr:hypothetical protein G6F22_021812 [Rhizopus arrhizus]KAG1383101.1 hypothetical protein G6F59_017816 [Rhizopus arrhizus]
MSFTRSMVWLNTKPRVSAGAWAATPGTSRRAGMVMGEILQTGPLPAGCPHSSEQHLTAPRRTMTGSHRSVLTPMARHVAA